MHQRLIPALLLLLASAGPAAAQTQNVRYIDGATPGDSLIDFVPVVGSVTPCSLPGAGDGDWQSTWEPNDPSVSVNDLEVKAGVLYAGGHFDYPGSPFIRNITRWDGTKWRDLDHGVIGTVYDMAWLGDELFVTGEFSVACSPEIKDMARWKEGSGWTSAGGVPMRAIASDGQRLFGLPRGSEPTTELVLWDGAQWSHVATFTGYARSLAFGVNGKLYVAGNITDVDGVPLSGVAGWDGIEWDSLGGGISGSCNQYGPAFQGVATDGARVYVWGAFRTGIAAQGVTYYEANSWHKTIIPGPCGSSSDGSFDAISILFPDGNAIYYGRENYDPNSCAENEAYSASTQVAMGTAPSVLANVLANDFVKYNNKITVAFGTRYQNALIATWNGTALTPLGDGLHSDTHGLNQPLRDIAIAPNGKRYIAGLGDGRTGVHAWTGSGWQNFTAFGGTTSVVFETSAYYKGWTIAGGRVNYFGNDPDDFVLRFDDSAFPSRIPDAPDNTVHCMVTGGGLLFMGGDFTHAGTLVINHVASWNGTSWGQLGPGLNGPVYALAYDDGMLYAGGDFTFSSRQQVRHLAVWDGHAWSPLNKGTDGPVYSILPTNDGLYVGGKFELAGATKARNIALLTEGTWQSLGDGFDDDVRGLTMSDGGWLYATGRFTHSGSAELNRVARWDGHQWSSMGQGLDNTGRDIAAVGNHIFFAGYFTMAGSTPSQYFAEWIERTPLTKRNHDHPALMSDANAASALGQNSPNPFNPTTQIPFTLASSLRVRVAIYDAQGRLVRSLVDEIRQPGNYSAMWNGRDDRGAAVASGVYFCVMRAGGVEATKKMVLLK
ncbi:MAG TPA: FlgD immunoglobulin-like domain containing protein [Candidatus Krumholzibacteria bacterium]|nr:FlgD immunoglobulin-like domain containing protein [Candidatus Krumholzibacteria bacterium]